MSEERGFSCTSYRSVKWGFLRLKYLPPEVTALGHKTDLGRWRGQRPCPGMYCCDISRWVSSDVDDEV